MNLEIDDIMHILARDEVVWLKMATDITRNSKMNKRDLLHDFYIHIHSKIYNGKIKIPDITHNDSLNKSFVYKTMYNIFIDTLRTDKDVIVAEELTNVLKANNEPYVDIESIVDEIVDSFYWFDRKLFNLYRKKFHSIRKLSAATNISHVVVWRTINNCIKEIKKKINEK